MPLQMCNLVLRIIAELQLKSGRKFAQTETAKEEMKNDVILSETIPAFYIQNICSNDNKFAMLS